VETQALEFSITKDILIHTRLSNVHLIVEEWSERSTSMSCELAGMEYSQI
jgi:hypothetical protein